MGMQKWEYSLKDASFLAITSHLHTIIIKTSCTPYYVRKKPDKIFCYHHVQFRVCAHICPTIGPVDLTPGFTVSVTQLQTHMYNAASYS